MMARIKWQTMGGRKDAWILSTLRGVSSAPIYVLPNFMLAKLLTDSEERIVPEMQNID